MFSLIWNIYMIVVKTKVAEQPCTFFLFAPFAAPPPNARRLCFEGVPSSGSAPAVGTRVDRAIMRSTALSVSRETAARRG